MKDILALTDEEILKEVGKIVSAYKLKKTIRFGSTREKVHTESVAEHIFALIYLAHYFLIHEPIGSSLDSALVYDTLLFHDFPEIKHGDVVTYQKTKEDEDREKAAAVEVFENLPESLGTYAHGLWEAFEEHATPETKFAWAIDKLEPIFELQDPINEKSLKRLKITRGMNYGNKEKACKDYPVMMRFLNVLSEDMDRRGVFIQEKKPLF